MAADPARMPSGIMIFIPSNGDNMIQQGQQIPGTVKCSVQYGNQQLTDAPQESLQKRSLAKCVNTEGKTLGAIQIMIGLVHLSFGSLPLALAGFYIPFYFSKTYPFMAGLLFIASGSVSVSAAKRMNVCLVRCSVGMNITSAVTSLSGIIFYALDIVSNRNHYPMTYHMENSYPMAYEMQGTVRIITGLNVLLLLFSSMEFIITVMVTEFWCRGDCCIKDPATTYVPCTVVTENTISVEDSVAPPSYNETRQ